MEKGFSFPAKEALLSEYRTTYTYTAQIFLLLFPAGARQPARLHFEGGGTVGTCQPAASKGAWENRGMPWEPAGVGHANPITDLHSAGRTERDEPQLSPAASTSDVIDFRCEGGR